MSLRMNAYYYSFDETSVKPIDLILSSVAWAGKYYHLTQQWNEKESPPEQLSGETPVKWIQNAAIAAAEELVKTKKLYEKEKEKRMIKPEDIKIKRLFHKYQFFISAENAFAGVFEMPALAEFEEKELKLSLLKQIYGDIVSESVARLREINGLFMMSSSVYANKGRKETKELIGCLQNLLQIDYKNDVSFGDRKC